MGEEQKARILIVGAGSMGIISGYYLSLAGTDVTYLVRPHRTVALNRPQQLYCYDDNQLKEYHGYSFLTDPTEIIGKSYDYVLITLDGAALRNEVGKKLVETIGQAARGTHTKVVLGSVFIDLRSWFLKVSGLADEQVTRGFLYVHIYSTKAVTLPVYEPADPGLIAKADYGYSDTLGLGFSVDDSSTSVAEGFSATYNACGVSKCVVKSEVECALNSNPMFAMFAALELLGWPRYKDVDGEGELWHLGMSAVREIQELGIHGEGGQQAASATTDTGFLGFLVGMEKQMLPFPLCAFNGFQHGKQVRMQDREHLLTCISIGEKEGKPMMALKELVERHQRQFPF